MNEENGAVQPQANPEDSKMNNSSTLTHTESRADAKLIEFVSMYTHGLINKMNGVQMCLVVLLIVCAGSSVHMYLAMQELKAESAKQAQIVERMDKRHWELSKAIELSQERSARKKAEKQDAPDLP